MERHSEQTINPAQDPRAEEVEAHVNPRRAKAQVAGDSRGTWGLALSGGGIRSATFCLGLIRGLAKNEVLKHFDYLSTVSGGGYLGASLGRLYGATHTAKQVEDGVKNDGSMWLWWLRNNGRYLTPTGAKDLGFATASIVRGIIATHLEIGILLLLLAGVVLFPHMLASIWPPSQSVLLTPWHVQFTYLTNSLWWWLIPLPAFVFLHQVVGYWYTREKRTVASMVVVTVAALTGLVAAQFFYNVAMESYRLGVDGREAFSSSRTVGAMVLALLLLTPATAWIATAFDCLRRTPMGELRLERTKRLSYAMWAFGLIAALAVIDSVSWFLTRVLWQWGPATFPLGKAALIGLLLAAGRYALPEIQKRMATAKKPSINLEKVLNLLGVVLAITALIFWTTLFNVLIFPRWSWDSPTALGTPLWKIPQFSYWLAIVAACFFYAVATRQSFELLNLASLHNFYRARIERAYVSSGNDQGDNPRFPDSALAPVTPERTMSVAPLTEAIRGDDIDLTHYAPHEYGGPIHLVNCCINQSVDDRTGIYNADRKGIALTVSSLGVEIGPAFAGNPSFATSPGSLSRWIAISGAAASTGMGSRTSPGFATLLFMSGIRLGYWTKALVTKPSPLRSGRSWAATALGEYAPKPLAIIAESLARFPGQFGKIWYVSDGGHFDNTGIYALLKRKCRLVVCADCGADPKYLFSDLESLVRKAKIDYNATIEFVDPNDVSGNVSPELRCLLGTPETITPDADARWLVLGRIRYADQTEGTLVVVKPRRLDKMPFDIVAYADRNPDFPQQTTGDQFFDESQWEAYHQLGLLMGKRLSKTNLKNAIATVDEMTNAPSSLLAAENQSPLKPLDLKNARRSRVGLTVKASLGAGISLSIILALWQSFDQYRGSKRLEDDAYQARYEALRDQLVGNRPLAMLDTQKMHDFRDESESRGDGRFTILTDLVNRHCSTLADQSSEQLDCQAVYERLGTSPPVRYNYWFVDRPSRTAPSKSPTRFMGHIAGATASTTIVPAPAAYPTMPQVIKVPAAAALYTLDLSCNPEGKGQARIYIHIYDELTRKEAQAIAERASAELALPRPPIENVVRTAERAGRIAPYRWSSPALVYHSDVSQECLESIKDAVGRPDVVLRELPSSYAPNPGMVEVWLPPGGPG